MVRGFEIPFEIPFNHSHGGRPARPAGGARLATPGLQASTWNPPPMSTPTFAEQLALLPPISHLAAVELLDAAGTVVATLANRPGTAGSAAVYHALAARHGAITPEAAARAWRSMPSTPPMPAPSPASIRTSTGWSTSRPAVWRR